MRAEYPPIEGELSAETAACQAAYALDSSATIAQQQRDHNGLLAVGEAWMKLADFLAALGQSEEKEAKKNFPMGFQAPVSDEELIETDEDEVEDVRDDDEE